MNDIAIKVDAVSKSFKLPHEKQSSIKGALLSTFRGKRTFEKQQVLNDISFEIKKGEFFGIVGRNGSGKSTLLKLLAGIYSPDDGAIAVNGSLTPFIELGVGFNPELTGRENVYLNGALLGFNRKEMEPMYDDIVDFAELEKFMDQKLKNYSSGMQVRLAFSIAIRARSKILLIDEVLAVGDISFQQKCYQVFDDLKEENRTIILVTHDMSAVQRFCDRAIVIDNGKILKSGKPTDIAETYLELNYENETQENTEGKQEQNITGVKLEGISLSDGIKKRSSYKTGEKVQISIDYSNTQQKPIGFGIQIFSSEGAYCFGSNTKLLGVEPTSNSAGVVELDIALALNNGAYYITVVAMNETLSKVLDYKPKFAKFRVNSSDGFQGVVSMNHKWKV